MMRGPSRGEAEDEPYPEYVEGESREGLQTGGDQLETQREERLMTNRDFNEIRKAL